MEIRNPIPSERERSNNETLLSDKASDINADDDNTHLSINASKIIGSRITNMTAIPYIPTPFFKVISAPVNKLNDSENTPPITGSVEETKNFAVLCASESLVPAITPAILTIAVYTVAIIPSAQVKYFFIVLEILFENSFLNIELLMEKAI